MFTTIKLHYPMWAGTPKIWSASQVIDIKLGLSNFGFFPSGRCTLARCCRTHLTARCYTQLRKRLSSIYIQNLYQNIVLLIYLMHLDSFY